MSFSSENGYVPVSIQTIMNSLMAGINTEFGTTYTPETFVATNHYKYFYAIAQRVQAGEVKMSEIFLKLQQFFVIMNERIQRPVGTPPGILENFARNGFLASIKPMIDADAGKISICVDVDDEADDYAEIKLAICTLIKSSVAGGIVSQGDQVETITLLNGQAFDFKFLLPDISEPLLRLTTTLSENNQVVIASPEDVKQKLINNIAARYRLGKNFEPQTYFSVADTPWTSQILLEYSLDDGDTWSSDVYDADFDEKFDIKLENITLVEE